ncbi:MAG TPA: hypothetical protein VGQ91_00285 [Ideonella sp.]|nr:hypothetical protein [Ideonella sp.]
MDGFGGAKRSVKLAVEGAGAWWARVAAAGAGILAGAALAVAGLALASATDFTLAAFAVAVLAVALAVAGNLALPFSGAALFAGVLLTIRLLTTWHGIWRYTPRGAVLVVQAPRFWARGL